MRSVLAFLSSTIIGILGGLIGGAEFRLPFLIAVFRFSALEVIILNKAMSLVVVAFALPFRSQAAPLSEVIAAWPVIAILLAGTAFGALAGAGRALRKKSATLHQVFAALLVIIATVLFFGHDAAASGSLLHGPVQIVCGVVAGVAIGLVASVLGVAGGELVKHAVWLAIHLW